LTFVHWRLARAANHHQFHHALGANALAGQSRLSSWPLKLGGWEFEKPPNPGGPLRGPNFIIQLRIDPVTHVLFRFARRADLIFRG